VAAAISAALKSDDILVDVLTCDMNQQPLKAFQVSRSLPINHTSVKLFCPWGVYFKFCTYIRSSPCKPPPNTANKLPTQFKALYTSSECKILDVISKPLTCAGNSAFWGAVWGPVRILHPLWQGKGAFLKLLRSTSASGYQDINIINVV
jgi:hypothetical protein